MPGQRPLFPSWKLPEPGRAKAVDQRLPAALRWLSRRNSGFDLELLADVLLMPERHWTQAVRVGRDGSHKPCWSPSKPLRKLQQQIAWVVFDRFGEWRYPAMAFSPGMSIIKNAEVHRLAGGRSSFRIDLKNAFPGVTTNHIAAFLLRENLGMTEDAAWVISRLLTFHGKLEQGAPVAPHIFNQMLHRLDVEIMQNVDVTYTRYADDLCLTSPLDAFPREHEVWLKRLVRSHHLAINRKKTRRAHHGNVDLPGIIIKQGRLRPNGNYVKRLLATWLGLNDAQKRGHRAYIRSFGHGALLPVIRDRIPLIPRSPRRHRYH